MDGLDCEGGAARRDGESLPRPTQVRQRQRACKENGGNGSIQQTFKIAQPEVLHLTVPISYQLNTLRENAAMNDGKSFDEAQATKFDAPAKPVQNDGADLRRRRLLRGAAGIAPVVLTLRSGSLAASSCVHVIATQVSTDATKKILGSPAGVAAVAAPNEQQCVRNYTAAGCPDQTTHIQPNGVSGYNVGVVRVRPSPNTDPTLLECSLGSAANSNQEIAILSAASYTSWGT